MFNCLLRLHDKFVWFLALFCLLLLAGCAHPPPLESRAAATPAPIAPPAAPARFEEVADTAGLKYQWTIAAKRPLNILQTIGNGCAFLDYDHDGNLDVLLVGEHPALFKGDGHGHFTDVSAQTGIAALKGHFLGCAVGDVDNDGYVDVYLSGYETGILLHNEGGLTPPAPLPEFARRLAGKGGALRATSSPLKQRISNKREASTSKPPPFPNEERVVREGGPGGLGRTFRDITVQAGLKPQPWGTSCAFVETTPGSGRLDLYVANYARFGPQPDIPQLCEFNGIASSCGPRYYHPLPGVLYRNLGNGRFADVSEASGMAATSGRGLGVAFADLDGTGRASLAIANDEMAGDLLKPRATTGYTNIGAASGVAYDRDGNKHGGMGLDWGDYDNDGKLDLFVATFQNEPKSLYHNDGGDQFSDVSYPSGLGAATAPNVSFGCKFFDYDNDGLLDIIIASGHVQDNIERIDTSTRYRQPTRLFHNQGGGLPFVEISGQAGAAFHLPIVGRGLAVGDYDNDGLLDALVVDSEGRPLLLHNQTQAAGHWLGLRLTGTHCNRSGYGALVTLQAGGRILLRHCHTDGSYLSASDPRVHFGLGAATHADILSVRWPDGHKDVFHALPADHYLDVREGAATPTPMR